MWGWFIIFRLSTETTAGTTRLASPVKGLVSGASASSGWVVSAPGTESLRASGRSGAASDRTGGGTAAGDASVALVRGWPRGRVVERRRPDTTPTEIKVRPIRRSLIDLSMSLRSRMMFSGRGVGVQEISSGRGR